MIRINELRLPINHNETVLINKIKKILNTDKSFQYEILRRSLDARKKPELFYSYVIDINIKDEVKVLKRADKKAVLVSPKEYKFNYSIDSINEIDRPVIIGLGPAGLFAALFLSRAGFKPIVIERGASVYERSKDVESFWKTGVLNTESNVQFGEGGAGAFSDGKLNTLVKDKYGRNREVLKILVEKGAPKEILYDHKPHVGTDRLIEVVSNISKEIIGNGGEIHYHTKASKFLITDGKIKGVITDNGDVFNTNFVILAVGHSARDTFKELFDCGVYMEPKPFAVGFRVEHPVEIINQNQYGSPYIEELGNSNYKLTHQCNDGRGVYSFCMCPGGYVVNASSEENLLAINGMSYYTRASKHSNSAIIVSINPKDYGDGINPLSGIEFQRKLEKKAYDIGMGKIPVETYAEYKDKKLKENVVLEPVNKGMWVHAPVHEILPDELSNDFIEGMEYFGRIIDGFNADETIVSGVESRTSSPLRINRDESFNSNILGLYPAGEGAGYAGGITSAAMDGIATAEKVAESILSRYE